MGFEKYIKSTNTYFNDMLANHCSHWMKRKLGYKVNVRYDGKEFNVMLPTVDQEKGQLYLDEFTMMLKAELTRNISAGKNACGMFGK